MPILYNSVNVDSKYSAILEPNLFADSILLPNVTYTDKYTIGPAGQILVHKLGVADIEPGTPGRDFSDVNVADALIAITLNNDFQRSRKIYNVQASAVSFAKGEEELALAIKEVSAGRQVSAIACVAKEGTAGAVTTAITSPKTDIVASRKTLKLAKAMPDVVLCSPTFYALVLEKAGTDFTPTSNDTVLKTGNVGQWLGFTFMECNAMGGNELKYYDNAGTLQTVDTSNIDYIMYDHNALSIIDNFSTARLIDSENFAGSKAQVEVNTGFRVTNSACVLVRSHA